MANAEYWPSTQNLRIIINAVSKMYGPEAGVLLSKIIDNDMRIPAEVEFAHALLGRERHGADIQ